MKNRIWNINYLCSQCSSCAGWTERGCAGRMDPEEFPDNGECWEYEPRSFYEHEDEFDMDIDDDI